MDCSELEWVGRNRVEWIVQNWNGLAGTGVNCSELEWVGRNHPIHTLLVAVEFNSHRKEYATKMDRVFTVSV